MGIELLKGRVILNITKNNFKDNDEESIIFETSDNKKYLMYHQQDCCESVTVEEIIGNLKDLIGNPILVAEERTNKMEANNYDSCTYTFYELATIKGSVTIRWIGTSNGYYSESVDFEERT